MADCSRGPVSSMPGSIHKVPASSTCDDHPDKIAIIRIQGETDSFVIGNENERRKIL